MFEHAMRDLDLLVTPSLRVTPPPSGSSSAQVGGKPVPLHTASTSLTMPFNLTGMPALTLPCAPSPDGLPVGIQLAGRKGDDWRVLDAGARLEALLQG
jgi:aspartyl-tRNA(Asn)/glutamyl-tRNA(Gln) amidotransferase subunit A